MKKNPQTVTFTINGENKTFITEPDEKLLALLRREGYKGAKFGCGQGTCGSCTVLMDGRAVYSCLLYAMQAEGREIRTIESIGSHDKPSEFQQELIDGGAVQCGYCIPGIVMELYALYTKKPDADDGEIKTALSRHFCRCTGYEAIWEGAKLAQQYMQAKA
jgi:aerobic-type carbon monoxide dehydrogenase small subunit (CoxS/CutS family)